MFKFGKSNKDSTSLVRRPRVRREVTAEQANRYDKSLERAQRVERREDGSERGDRSRETPEIPRKPVGRDEASERTDLYREALGSIRNTVFRGAEELKPEIPEFYRELLKKGTWEPSLVKLAMNELRRQIANAREDRQSALELEEKFKNLASRMPWDETDIQEYKMEISNSRKRGNDKIKALQGEIEDLRVKISELESVDSGQPQELQADLKEEHELEIKQLKEDHESEISGIDRNHAQQLATFEKQLENTLKERHALDLENIREMKNKETSQLKADLKKREERISELEAQLQDQEPKYLSRITDLKRKHRAELEKLQDGHVSDLNRAMNDHKYHKSQWEELKSAMQKDHSTKVGLWEKHNLDMQQNHATEVDKLKRQHNLFTEKLKKDHQKNIDVLNDQIDKIKSDNQNILSGIEQNYSFEMEKLRKDHEETVSDLVNNHQNQCQGLEDQINMLQRNNQKSLNDIQRNYESRIEKLQEKQGKEIEDLRNKHQGESKMLNEHIDKMERDYEKDFGDMQQKHEREVSGTKIKHQKECQILIGKMDEMERGHNNYVNHMKQNHTLTMEKLKKDHDKKIESMENEHKREYQTLNAQMDRMERGYQKDFDDIQQRNTFAVENLKKEHYKTICDMKDDHQDECQILNNQMDKLKEDHLKTLNGLSDEHRNQCQILNGRMEKTKEDHAAEITNLKKQFETEKTQILQQSADSIARLKKEYQDKITNLKQKHAAETEKIRKERDSYSAALLARDKARDKPRDPRDKVDIEMKDVDIRDKFEGITEEVKKLAQLEWKSDQVQAVRRFPKPLMRQMLLDAIWVVLHEHIFCSPFRIFGEEGATLEKQWNDECGKDPALDNGSYVWPTPEVETERWRYVTVKECRAALRKPVPSEWDPRAKLKKGFAIAMENLRGNLKSILDEVVDLDKSNIQTIKDLTLKATNVWLEMGMQRFRVVVIVQGSHLKSIKERIAKVQQSTLELVLLPELKSHGNSKGDDLHVEETIRGCEGEIVSFKGSQRRG